MGTIVRGPKAAGGTNFTSGTTILNDEVDTDFNTAYSEINGNLANVNINGSADIAQTKIADHGTQATQTTPGTPGSESAPTTLAGDIERLRYALAQLKFGNASDQGGALEWFERSVNLMNSPQNILPNSSFAAFQAPASTTPPDGWAATTTPATQYDHTALVAGDGLGLGYYVSVTGAGSANTGFRYTIPATSLRPSTTYVVYAMGWATAGDTARIFTSGASVDLDAETTDTTPDLLQGYFTTDATPTAVILHLVSKGATDVSKWFGAVCLPVVTTARQQGYTSAFLQLESAGTALSLATSKLALGATTLTNYANVVDGAATVLRRNITVPGVGYRLRVTATVCGTPASASTSLWHFILVESTDAEVTYAVRDAKAAHAVNSTNGAVTVVLTYTADATPGAKYWFKVMGGVGAGANFAPQSAASGTSSINVELIPKGV